MPPSLADRLILKVEVSKLFSENDLIAIVPKGKRTLGAHRLIFHGRQVCVARKPLCEVCPILTLCPRIGVE